MVACLFGQSIFHLASTTRLKSFDSFAEQKKSAWSMIAIDENTKDQLRQRVAWALSQILVITPNQIENEDFSEMHLSYYDIFVKVSTFTRIMIKVWVAYCLFGLKSHILSSVIRIRTLERIYQLL